RPPSIGVFLSLMDARNLNDSIHHFQRDGVLVYLPEFIEVAKTTPVVNATDVEHVINKYRLAVEVVSVPDHLITLVDAYTGEGIPHISLMRDMRITLPGAH